MAQILCGCDWNALVATAPIQPLAWEFHVPQKAKRKKKKKKKKTINNNVPQVAHKPILCA